VGNHLGVALYLCVPDSVRAGKLNFGLLCV